MEVVLELISFLILGIFVGLVSTFFGAGGGVFIVPLLPLIYPIGIREVVPTSLLTVLGVVAINTIFFKSKGLVAWGVGLATGISAAISALLISKISFSFEQKIIYQTIAFILCLSAFLLVLVPRNENYFRGRDPRKSLFIAIVVGIFAGLGHGLSGIGAGLLITPIFLVFNVVPYSQVVPTSNLCMIFSCLFGLLGYISEVPTLSWTNVGPARLDIAAMILVGTFFSAPFGRKYQDKMPETLRRVVLAIMLIGLATQVVVKYL